MKHTQEQLAAILNNQYERGRNDARSGDRFGRHDYSADYPNPAWPDVSRQAASDAYKQGWGFQQRKMGTPDAVSAEQFGKGVRHE